MQELIFRAPSSQFEQSRNAANIARQPGRSDDQSETFAQTLDRSNSPTRDLSETQEIAERHSSEPDGDGKAAKQDIKDSFVFQSRVAQTKPAFDGSVEVEASEADQPEAVSIEEMPEGESLDAEITPDTDLKPSQTDTDAMALWKSRRAQIVERVKLPDDSFVLLGKPAQEAAETIDPTLAVDEDVPLDLDQTEVSEQAALITPPTQDEEDQDTGQLSEPIGETAPFGLVQSDKALNDSRLEFAALQRASAVPLPTTPVIAQAAVSASSIPEGDATSLDAEPKFDAPKLPSEPRVASNGTTATETGSAAEVKTSAAALMQNYVAEWQFVSQRDTAMVQADPMMGIVESTELARGSTQPLGVTPTAATTPQIAQNAFAQIVVAVDQAKTNNFEIVLDPEELGTVRILMTPKDGGYDITVIASREQTLDMMRKYASDLQNSFAEMGYSETTLDFQSSENDESGFQRDDDGTPSQTGAEPITDEPQQLVTLSGLDLRL